MKIVIPGGSGQVGTVAARHFAEGGHEVVVLSRTSRRLPWRVLGWDAKTLGPWAHEIDGADVVLNLAGRSVNCRYTEANRREILHSRTESTRVVGEAIARAQRPPRVWLQASTATVYAHRFDAPNDEATGILGGHEPDVPASWHFSITVATAWERALAAAETPKTRKVALRSAMTMSPERGGIFDTLLGLVRKGLGGTCGDGRQYVSWIHEADFLAALDWIIAREHLSGAINLAAPEPLPNAAFMRTLREAWGTRIGLPATRWMLELGAIFLRTETELILKSRRVVPGRLRADGFSFTYPHWRPAADDLCARWREAHSNENHGKVPAVQAC
ncbi:MAG: TIGR01777 family oxidoreductase [Planctomycetota bacterium]|nr:TIGR01777 family oxidoreductase [Planctomycetota bacterium]